LARLQAGGLTVPWVRVDDTLCDDPRILAVPLDAFGLLHVGLGWSNRHLTDGFVADALFRSRAKRATDRLLSALAAHQLVTPCERDGVPGWRLAADLVALQPTREQVLKDRADARERQQKHRQSQRDERVTTPTVTPASRRDRPVTETPVTTLSHDPVPSRPDPLVDQDQSRSRATTRAPNDKESEDALTELACGMFEDLIARDVSGFSEDAFIAELETRAVRAGLRTDADGLAEAVAVAAAVTGTYQ